MRIEKISFQVKVPLFQEGVDVANNVAIAKQARLSTKNQ
jgi:hypothetical protein